MPKKKKMTIAGIIVLALALCVGIYEYNVYQEKVKAFDAAAQLFETGNYAGAEEAFTPLKSFRNSDNLVTISDVYDQLEKENYEDAAKISENITDYSSSDENLQKAIDIGRAKYYATAQSLASEENYENASQIYDCLGDYEDSEQSAVYYDGMQEEVDGNLEEAITLFDQVGDYKDASDQKDLCSTYLEASQLQEKGDDASLEQAAELFTQLGDFQDSAARALQCKSVALFREAKALADAKKYKKAYKILNQYPLNPYEGWGDLLRECDNQIDYKEAKKLYNSGHFYKASLLFNGLNDFKDSKKMAKKCKRGLPSKNILYHNPDYESSSVKLTIDNSGLRNTYIKLYTSKDKLVARIFIKKDQKATINLTSGTYHLNRAYGDDWYGEKDMFGDMGSYLKCMVGGSYDFTLKSGYIYTLGKGSGGSAVSGQYIGSGSF